MSLEEIDYDVNAFNPASREADKNLAVKFYVQPLKDDFKSVEQGRPIFADTEMVEIRVRGDRNNVIHRPAREDDRKRFREAYNAFKENRATIGEGTPLSEWPIMTGSMVEELKYFGFHTVEQLAKADDAACGRMAGLQTYKQKANIFLEFSKSTAPLEQLSARTKELESQLEMERSASATMSAQMEELTKKFNKLAEKVAAK